VRGPVWYAKYQLPSGRQVQKKIGPAWSGRGRPPPGYFTKRTVAKYLVILHGIFRRAMKVWGLPVNPAAMVERPRFRVSNDLDAFSPEEVWALVRAAGSAQDADELQRPRRCGIAEER
jgi:hypothetical protein